MPTTLQEERYPLIVSAARIWETNSIWQMPDRRLVKTPLFHPDGRQHMATGFVALIAHTKPTVLYVDGGRLSAKMIEVALSAQLSELPN